MRYLPKLNLNKYIDEDKILKFPERFNFQPELNQVWKKLFQNQDIGMYDICTEVFGNDLDRETFEKLRKEIYETIDLCIGYFIQEGFSIYEIADKFQKMNFRYIKYLTDPYFGFSGTEY